MDKAAKQKAYAESLELGKEKASAMNLARLEKLKADRYFTNTFYEWVDEYGQS